MVYKMSKGDKVPNDVKSFLRSVLISSNGVKESRVQKDYRELAGEKLMWRDYGFRSLNEFLSALPDVCVLQYNAKDRENRVYGVQLEGTFMSSHAKKNSKVALAKTSPVKPLMAPEGGRLVEKEGDTFKITLSNTIAQNTNEGADDLMPNNDGLFQVYVMKLPESCTEYDLRVCFQAYGNVFQSQIVKSSIGKKVGFVRYKMKSDALRALAEGKKNPPKIHGVQLEVGKPKRKSNSNNETSSEFSEGSLSSTSSSPIKCATVSSVIQELPTKTSTSLPQKHFPDSQKSGPMPVSLPHSTVALVSHGLVPPNIPLQPPTQSVSIPFPMQVPKSLHSTVAPLPQGRLPPNIPLNPPKQSVSTPLSVQVPTSPHYTIAANSKSPWTVSHNAPTKTLLSVHPASQVQTSNDKNINKAVSSQQKTAENKSQTHEQCRIIVTGYDGKVSEATLKLTFQSVCDIERLEYQPHHSIAWLRSKDSAKQAANELNGKLINGCLLLVKPLAGCLSVPEQTTAAKVVREEKLPEHQNEFSKIYDFYCEAISRCCEQQYLNWLNDLPSIFEVRIMDLIDPCTYWVHLADGTSTYQAFNDLVGRLSNFNPSPGLGNLKKNEFGAGKFTEDDLWYRCYCREVSTDGRNVHVMYIDYGNTEWLKRERTVLLNDIFELRPQGVLVKLSGLRFNPNSSGGVDNSVLSSAKKLLMYQCFQARKASELSSDGKSFLLEIEFLQSKGETVFDKLTSLPGVEREHKQSSPVIPLLLSSPPSIPTILKPLKDRLSDVNAVAVHIWITDIRSPTTFYFQVVHSEARETIRQIQEILLKCNVQNKVMVKDPKINGLVCYHKNGLERSRVEVKGLATSPGMVKVLHVDTGKLSVVPQTSFIALPSDAREKHYQARPARLYGVSDNTLAESSQALEFIIGQATQVLRAIVVDRNEDESVVLELFNSEGTNINKIMLEMSKLEDVVPTRNQAMPPQKQAVPPQNQAMSSSGIPMAFQNGVSPSSSSQVSPNQIFQASPTGTLPQMRASPDQASVRNQNSPYQPFTQNPVRPEQTSTRVQATSYPTQAQARPTQISPNATNQPLTNGLANVNGNQTSSNQIIAQNQAAASQAYPPNQVPPENRASPNQAPPRSRASPNQAPPQSQKLSNQAPLESRAPYNQVAPQNQALPNQVPPRSRASSNQVPPQSRVSSNRAFSPNQAPPQNQAFAQNQAPPKSRAQSEISPNQNIHSSQIPAPGQTRVMPNQGYPLNRPSTVSPNQVSQQISPQISPNQNNDAYRAPQNRALGYNQAQPPKLPSPNQAFSGASTNQTFAHHKPPQSHQAPPQNRAPSGQTATRHQAVPQNTQSWQSPSQGSNNFPNTMGKTSQSSVSVPNSRFYNAARPMAFQNFQEKEVSITSRNMTTPQGHVPQTNNPGGVSTSQHRASSHVMTSQAPTSQQSTSSGLTSSLTATSGNVMGKTCSTSKKSFNSDENRDGSDPNTKQEMNKTSNERQSSNISNASKDESNSSPEGKTSAMNQKSNKPKFPAQTGRKAQKTSKNYPKTFTSGETGSGEMAPATEMNARSFPGKGRKAFSRTNREASFGAKKLQAIISDQEKVLSTSGPEQYQAVEIHRSREKCERKKVTDMIQMLENENLMLEGEIRRNREEKAKLERELKQQ